VLNKEEATTRDSKNLLFKSEEILVINKLANATNQKYTLQTNAIFERDWEGKVLLQMLSSKACHNLDAQTRLYPKNLSQ